MNILCAYSIDLVKKHVNDMNSLRIQIVIRKSQILVNGFLCWQTRV